MVGTTAPVLYAVPNLVDLNRILQQNYELAIEACEALILAQNNTKAYAQSHQLNITIAASLLQHPIEKLRLDVAAFEQAKNNVLNTGRSIPEDMQNKHRYTLIAAGMLENTINDNGAPLPGITPGDVENLIAVFKDFAEAYKTQISGVTQYHAQLTTQVQAAAQQARQNAPLSFGAGCGG